MFESQEIASKRVDLAKLILTGAKQHEFHCVPIDTKFILRTLTSDEEMDAMAETTQHANDIVLRVRMNKVVTLSRAIVSWNGASFGGDGPNAVKAESFLAALQYPVFDFIWWCYEDMIRLRNFEVEDLITKIKKSLGSRGLEKSGPSSPPIQKRSQTSPAPQKST